MFLVVLDLFLQFIEFGFQIILQLAQDLKKETDGVAISGNGVSLLRDDLWLFLLGLIDNLGLPLLCLWQGQKFESEYFMLVRGISSCRRNAKVIARWKDNLIRFKTHAVVDRNLSVNSHSINPIP